MIRRKLSYMTVMFTAFLGTSVLSHDAIAADPAEAKTVGRIISQREDLSSFLKVLEKAELGSALAEKTDINYTVFVPNNAAFDSLPEGAVKTLLDPRNDDRWRKYSPITCWDERNHLSSWKNTPRCR